MTPPPDADTDPSEAPGPDPNGAEAAAPAVEGGPRHAAAPRHAARRRVDPVLAIDDDGRPVGPGPSLVEAVRTWIHYEHAPLITLVVVAVTWFVTLGRLILLRHHNIATFDFDEGIYDQYLWQLAHLRQANTVRGVTLLGHHASPAFLLLAPLAWFGAGVQTWDIIHTATLASGAFPLFFLARDKLKRPWLACAAGLVWLGQPTVQWLVHEGFHPDGMALPFLLGTYLYGERYRAERALGAVSRRTSVGLIACFVGAISWKEDIALALVGMGIVWLIRREWHLAGWVIAAAGLWFVLFGMILVPHFAGGSVYGGIYDLGTTPGEIVSNSLHHPSRLAHKLDQNDALGYTRGLSQSYGFVSFASPETLLIGAPQWFTNIISASGFTWDLRFHYQGIPMVAMAISFVEGLRRLLHWRRWIGEGLVVAALVATLLCTRWYGPLPIGIKYRYGYWPLTPAANIAERRADRDQVPGSAGVSADYLMVPQMTHRQVVYTFPNPWRPNNYGVKPGAHGDPAKVEWVLVDTGLLGDRDKALLASIEASGEFVTVHDAQSVVLLHRVRAPGQGTAPIVVD